MGGSARIAVLATALILAGCSSSPKPPGLGYNTDPVREARLLKVCDQPAPFNTVARCTYPDGSVVAVAAIASSEAQLYAAALADNSTTGCVLLGEGFEIQAPDRAALAAHVDVSSMQSKYHATLHGRC